MKSISALIISFALMSTASLVQAGGDVKAGKTKSATCAACHGAAGISNNPVWPNLAAQKEAYLVKQLKAFKDGSRKDPMMGPMAMPLTDADMANLAACFSSLK